MSIGHRPTGLARAVTLAALLLASQSLIVSAAEAGQTISGLAYVIDGDTISINGQHIRLNGIDAPEVANPHHPFEDPFGPESHDEMRAIIGRTIITCRLSGEKSYDRYVGVCRLPTGEDIGALIVSHGLALDCAHCQRRALSGA